jgi:ClpA/ClpB-like protein
VRPLKRTIECEVETALGRSLLGGEIHEGDGVTVGFNEKLGAVSCTPKARAEEPSAHRAKAGCERQAPGAVEEDEPAATATAG